MNATMLGTAGGGRVGAGDIGRGHVRDRGLGSKSLEPRTSLHAHPVLVLATAYACLCAWCLLVLGFCPGVELWGKQASSVQLPSASRSHPDTATQHGPTVSVWQQERMWEVMGSVSRAAHQRQRHSCLLLSRRLSGKVEGKALLQVPPVGLLPAMLCRDGTSSCSREAGILLDSRGRGYPRDMENRVEGPDRCARVSFKTNMPVAKDFKCTMSMDMTINSLSPPAPDL